MGLAAFQRRRNITNAQKAYTPQQQDLSTMTVQQMRQYAANKEIELPARGNREEILAVIENARG